MLLRHLSSALPASPTPRHLSPSLPTALLRPYPSAPHPPRISGLWFLADAISPDEESAILFDAKAALARLAYEDGHFDKVIRGFREIVVPWAKWSSEGSREAIERMRAIVEASGCGGDGLRGKPWMEPHVIDLKGESLGQIDRHVDSLKHGGDLVVGLSLLSQRTMRLDNDDGSVALEVDLPPRSLYVLSGPARFEFAHAIKPGPQQRISIMLRDEAPMPPWMVKAMQQAALKSSKK